MDNLAEAERGQYRGVCIKYGFNSLAVIPIRYRDMLDPKGAIVKKDVKITPAALDPWTMRIQQSS